MIQSFQKFSQSRPAKIFLAIVALSFVAFFGEGIGFNPVTPMLWLQKLEVRRLAGTNLLKKYNSKPNV